MLKSMGHTAGGKDREKKQIRYITLIADSTSFLVLFKMYLSAFIFCF